MDTTQMKPYPYTEVTAIEQMCDMRDEITSLRIQLENAERCMMSLQRKRQNLIIDAREEIFSSKCSMSADKILRSWMITSEVD